MIKLSDCQLENKMTLNSSRTLKTAFDMIKDIEKGLIKINLSKRNIQVIHTCILMQECYFQLGRSQLKLKKFKSAAKSFTFCLIIGPYFCPKIRKESLLYLIDIFNLKNKSIVQQSCLQRILLHFNKEPRKIAFMIDTSEEMGNENIHKGVQIIQNIFEQDINGYDKVSLISFSKIVRVLFSLVEKWKNTDNLMNQIRSMMNWEALGKANSLIKSILEGINQLKLEYNMNEDNCPKWIIMISQNATSYISEKDINSLITILQQARINLFCIIIGNSNLKEANIPLKLAKLCRDSLYIENPSKQKVHFLMNYLKVINTQEELIITERIT